MGDVLSQGEIDSLLQQLSSGEINAEEIKDNTDKQVKNYDFARPSKFSKEHLRTLEIIFEHYGRLLSTNLPVYLRKNIQVEVMNSEAVTYSEFTNALSNPVLLGVVEFAPLRGWSWHLRLDMRLWIACWAAWVFRWKRLETFQRLSC